VLLFILVINKIPDQSSAMKNKIKRDKYLMLTMISEINRSSELFSAGSTGSNPEVMEHANMANPRQRVKLGNTIQRKLGWKSVIYRVKERNKFNDGNHSVTNSAGLSDVNDGNFQHENEQRVELDAIEMDGDVFSPESPDQRREICLKTELP